MCTTVAWSFLDVIRSVALTLRRCFTNMKACILLLICRYSSQTLLRLCNQKIFMYYFNISKHLVLNCLVRYVHVDKNMCVIIRIEFCSKNPAFPLPSKSKSIHVRSMKCCLPFSTLENLFWNTLLVSFVQIYLNQKKCFDAKLR